MNVGAYARLAAVAACLVIDVAILTALAVVLLVIMTGGGLVHVGGVRIRARTVHNPLRVLTVLVVLRYALRRHGFFLLNRRWSVESWAERSIDFASRSLSESAGRLFRKPLRTIALLSAAICVVKIAIAWTSPGFFSGDDVEIHEMTLGALLGTHWPVWDLRSAFFPMTFIYPAQRLAVAAGASSPEVFVFAGRLVVALLSTAVIPLTWMASRRLAPTQPLVAALAVLFVAVNKLQVSFGTSELPRPVSAVFVLGAFVVLLRGGLPASAVAGVLLGIAGMFRFSEMVFIVPAVVMLAYERQWLRAAVLVLATGLTAAAVSALSDMLYWGAPFSSVRAAIDYTLVERQSSRGYEPLWEYARIIPAWSTPAVVTLAIAGSARRQADTLWLWMPIAILSMLPHKESRYLIPVVPFLSIAAARGVLRAIDWIRARQPLSHRAQWIGALFMPLLALSVLDDAGGWRLARSNEAVRLAQRLRHQGPGGIAAQESWRLGGQPYLWRHEPLVELSPERLVDHASQAEAFKDVRWVALRSRTARTIGANRLRVLGFETDTEWRGEDYVLFVRSAPVSLPERTQRMSAAPSAYFLFAAR